MAHPQQTVKLAIDCETREVIAAEALLALSEVEFTALRRAAMTARGVRRRGGNADRFRCAICRHPLYLSRRISGIQNRWFVHDGKSEDCPWYEGNRLSPEQTKALIYRGQQEGASHRAMKEFIGTWLAKDPLVSEINQEQTTFGSVLKGEWRRPDVKCSYRGTPLVFEIQLSYTFLSDVIARDEFYRREGIFIIWVFAKFEPNRAVVTDEAFFNRRNLFVLDKEAMHQTAERGSLTFSGVRQVPTLVDEQIHDVWTSEYVQLADVIFPNDTLRPYFFDYDSELKKMRGAQIDTWREQQKEAWSQNIQAYLDAALKYYDSDYAADLKVPLLAAVDHLSESTFWHRGFECLTDEGLYGYHAVLPVLLSIRMNRSVGYSKKFSVYQVMEVGLRTGRRGVGQHAFAILYLWAYKHYVPTMTAQHRQWLKQYAHKLKTSVQEGDDTYRRYTGYDEAICLLFPELENDLSTDFGASTNSLA